MSEPRSQHPMTDDAALPATAALPTSGARAAEAASSPVVGVLALQGGVVEHMRAAESLGARAVKVRAPEDLEGIDALILPGGESSTVDLSLIHI